MSNETKHEREEKTKPAKRTAGKAVTKKTAKPTAKPRAKKAVAVIDPRKLLTTDSLKLLFPMAQVNEVCKVIRDKFPSDDFYFNCDDAEERRFVKAHLKAEKEIVSIINRVPITEARAFREKLDAIRDELVGTLRASSKPLNDSLNAWQAKRDEERKAKAEAKRIREEAERAELERLRAEAEKAKKERELEQIRIEAREQARIEAEERAERERQALEEHNRQLAEQAKQLAEAQEQAQAYAREQEKARMLAEQEAFAQAQEQERIHQEQMERLRQEQEQATAHQEQFTTATSGAELNSEPYAVTQESLTHNEASLTQSWQPTKSELLATMGLTKIDIMLAGGVNEDQARAITLAIKRGQIRNVNFYFEEIGQNQWNK